jgi:hypothetical protein
MIGLALLSVSVSAGAQARSMDSVYTYSAKVVDSLPLVSEFKAPAIYAAWWAETAACLHLDPLPDAIVAQIRFMQVNAIEFRPRGGSYGLAASFASELQMYVAASAIGRKDVVTHEMVHFLLWGNGKADHDHPREYFEACGIHTTLPLQGK